MDKTKVIILCGLVLLIACTGFLALYKNQITAIKNPLVPEVAGYKNLTYVIDGKEVVLVNGFSEIPVAQGSASKVTTRFFGNEAFGDLNNDDKEDVVFFLTQETGGSGTFYYLAGALKNSNGYQATSTVFLGDRIAPQTITHSAGVIAVNYADRKPGEPMSVDPSVGVSRYFKVEGGQTPVLVEQIDKADFGKPINVTVGKKVQFEDGLVVLLKEINDSRCKPGVVCIWAGELSILLDISLANEGNVVYQVRLGTVNNKKVVNNGYVFELSAATEGSATIIVTKASTASGGCYVGGCSG
jgi:hypothetical protein